LKIAILGSAIPSTIGGGGPFRDYNTIIGLKKYFDIVFLPETNFLKSLSRNDEQAQRALKGFEQAGLEIPIVSLKDLSTEFIESWIKEDILMSTTRKLGRIYADYLQRNGKPSILYAHDENSTTCHLTQYIAKLTETKYGCLLKGPPFWADYLKPIRFAPLKFLSIKEIRNVVFSEFLRNLSKAYNFKRVISDKFLAFLIGVTEAPYLDANIRDFSNRFVLDAPSITNPELLSYRSKNKEEYSIFVSRLVPEKGLFELPEIWKYVIKEIPSAKLYITGPGTQQLTKIFCKLCKRVNISNTTFYMGYKPQKELYRLISKAKLLVYPSHFDSFSNVVFESLCLGTPVVTYDIPAMKIVYGKFKAVKTVREFDRKSLACEVVNILNTPIENLQEIMNERILFEFLQQKITWQDIINSEARIILNILKAN
jgi:glycosyltransferase involved in cell wall biosynthesis